MIIKESSSRKTQQQSWKDLFFRSAVSFLSPETYARDNHSCTVENRKDGAELIVDFMFYFLEIVLTELTFSYSLLLLFPITCI